jgi:hypothetical protein
MTELTVLTFIGLLVVAALLAVGAYTVLTMFMNRGNARSYRYETDEDGNDKVVDEND